MNRLDPFQEPRKAYENLSIPDTLEERVREGIRQGRAARALQRKRRTGRWLSAAACFAVLLAGLSLSPAAAADGSFCGSLFRVLTLVNYNGLENGIDFTLEVPSIEADGDAAASVNAVIQSKVDQHLEKARRDWADYKEAFFATGGTEEQWGNREMDVTVNYEIKSQTETQVSFVITLTENWVTSVEERYCYNLNLVEDRTITLRDLLGEDWVRLSNAAIQRQIDASADAEGFTYFFSPENGGFTTVDENTAFYIREDGVPVAVFPRFSIAAKPAGCPEFPLA